MSKREIEPLLDTEIDAVMGGNTETPPGLFWEWPPIPGFPRPPWISPTPPSVPGGEN